MTDKEKIEELKEYLINEKVKFLMYQDRADPDVGFGLFESVAREEAEKYFECVFKSLEI